MSYIIRSQIFVLTCRNPCLCGWQQIEALRSFSKCFMTEWPTPRMR